MIVSHTPERVGKHHSLSDMGVPIPLRVQPLKCLYGSKTKIVHLLPSSFFPHSERRSGWMVLFRKCFDYFYFIWIFLLYYHSPIIIFLEEKRSHQRFFHPSAWSRILLILLQVTQDIFPCCHLTSPKKPWQPCCRVTFPRKPHFLSWRYGEII